jgi:hypothetical protein
MMPTFLFLASLVAAAFGTQKASTPQQVTVWLLTEDQNDAIARGARMGAEEVTRTSALLGAKFTFHVAPRTSVLTQVQMVAPAFVILDLPETEACGIALKLASIQGVVLMNARVEAGPCTAPVLSLRLPQLQRRAILRRPENNQEVRIEEWDASLQRFGAQELNERYQRWTRGPMNSDAWAGWFGVKVASEASLRMDEVTRNALCGPDAPSFDGHKGVPLRFDAFGVLEQPVYVIDGSGKVIKEIQ